MATDGIENYAQAQVAENNKMEELSKFLEQKVETIVATSKGNENNEEIKMSFIGERADNGTYSSDTVIAKVEVKNIPLANKVKFIIKKAGSTEVVEEIKNIEEGQAKYTIEEDGEYQIAVQVLDSAGAILEKLEEVTLKKHSIKPVIAVNKGKITGNSINISANIEKAENGLPENVEYNYYISEKGSNIDESKKIYSGTENSYTYKKLKTGTEYEIKVTAKDAVGVQGEANTIIKTLNYGTKIEQAYGDIYYGTTSGISSASITNSQLNTGNTRICYGLIQENRIGKTLINQPKRYEAGMNITDINGGGISDTWIAFDIGWSTLAIESCYVIFENGEELTINQAVEKGYIAPLVLCHSKSGVTPMPDVMNWISRRKYWKWYMGKFIFDSTCK